MIVVRVEPHTSPFWAKLTTSQRSDVFHSAAWLRVLHNTYGLNLAANIVIDKGLPIAGLPYAVVEDFRPKRAITLPFSDYCDPLVSNPLHWKLLTEPLVNNGVPYKLRTLHNTLPQQDNRLTQTAQAHWHGIDLQRGQDDVWQGLHSSARRAIRKAEKAGVHIRQAQSKADLRTFYEMHLAIRKYKYGLLAQPYRFFEQIWEQFLSREWGTLLLAEYQGRVVAGVLFLEWQDTLYYKFNASVRTMGGVRPNDAIVWQGILHGQKRGLTCFDFGLSDSEQAGLLQFKRKYATIEKRINFLHYRPSSATPSPTPDLLPQLTSLFTDPSVPDHITEQAGELLYPYFL